MCESRGIPCAGMRQYSGLLVAPAQLISNRQLCCCNECRCGEAPQSPKSLLSDLLNVLITCHAQQIDEDPDQEFPSSTADDPVLAGPRIIDVGIPGPGFHPLLWRRAWRDKILPALVNFKPDLIMISAGFDAHRKDEINFRWALGVQLALYTSSLVSSAALFVKCHLEAWYGSSCRQAHFIAQHARHCM